MSKPTTLNWRTDPGHEWLIVSRAEFADAGLSESDISPYSYQKGDLLALEEDLDAGVYITARFSEDEIAALRHEETAGDNPRNWSGFGTKGRAA
ncbi:MAG: hypothetical protein AAFN79_12385 [Pseudomonadota bacterium]